jgi:hypothetical protein
MIPDNSILNVVVVILSISAAVLPILFGYVVFRMSQVFVSKSEFLAYQQTLDKDNISLRKQIDEIDRNTIELLQRTAHLRGHDKL